MTGIYLDYNGSAPIDPRVIESITTVMKEGIGNASSVHGFGQMQQARVERAREYVAALVGGRSRDVIFTSGATEANNLVLKGLVESAPQDRPRVLVSAVEHASIREAARWLASESKAKVEHISVTPGGFVDINALAEQFSDDVRVVSVMAANSETGVINDLARVADIARSHGALLHCDATQMVGRIRFDMAELGIDLVSISSHKICGPGGAGALVGSKATKNQLRALIHGGGHERELRSGSLNIAGIVGFGHAAHLAAEELDADAAHMIALRDQLLDGICNGLSGVEQNGDSTRRLPNTANLRFAGADAQAVMVNMAPVAVSTGSACSSGTIEPSPVLLAMGVAREAADESLRFSLGRFTTTDEIAEAVTRTIGAVEFVRSMNGSA